jgi:hypothetical protein
VKTETLGNMSTAQRGLSPGRRLFTPSAFGVWGLLLAKLASIAVFRTSAKLAGKRTAEPMGSRQRMGTVSTGVGEPVKAHPDGRVLL